MFENEVVQLLLQVVKSWQVIAVTAALVVYIFLVNYVARAYYQPKAASKSRPRRTKSQMTKVKAIQDEIPEVEDKANSNEALGLEED